MAAPFGGKQAPPFRGQGAPDYAALARAKKRKKRIIKPTKAGQKPINFTPGGLHTSLGVPQGQPLPPGKVAAAASGAAGAKARKQALFLKNVLHH